MLAGCTVKSLLVFSKLCNHYRQNSKARWYFHDFCAHVRKYRRKCIEDKVCYNCKKLPAKQLET